MISLYSIAMNFYIYIVEIAAHLSMRVQKSLFLTLRLDIIGIGLVLRLEIKFLVDRTKEHLTGGI